MRPQGRSQLHGHARAWGLVALVGLRQAWLRLVPRCVERLADGPRSCRAVASAPTVPKMTARPPALAATTSAGPWCRSGGRLAGLGPQRGGLAAAALGDAGAACKGFFCASYSVVASVTRGLPGAAGQVSPTRGAGLPRPSAMAAAAGMAMRSSLSAAVDATAGRTAGLGEDNGRLMRAGPGTSRTATSVHHGHVRSPAVAPILIRRAHFMCCATPAPPTPAGEQARGHAGSVGEHVGHNGVRWRLPARPTARDRPIGDSDGEQAPRRRRVGAVRCHSTTVEESAQGASRALLEKGGEAPQATMIAQFHTSRGGRGIN